MVRHYISCMPMAIHQNAISHSLNFYKINIMSLECCFAHYGGGGTLILMTFRIGNLFQRICCGFWLRLRLRLRSLQSRCLSGARMLSLLPCSEWGIPSEQSLPCVPHYA